MAGNVKAAEFLRETAGTGASGIERSDRLAMDKERFELDKERRKNESENADNDGMPVIIDVRP